MAFHSGGTSSTTARGISDRMGPHISEVALGATIGTSIRVAIVGTIVTRDNESLKPKRTIHYVPLIPSREWYITPLELQMILKF